MKTKFLSTISYQQKKLILLSGLGGIFEFYDFIVYIFFASFIAKNFFPAENSLVSLMAVFVTFFVGYLARPIGGLIFGHYGDKIGRKKTFTASIFIMAVATFSIGLLPTYVTIGIAAPILLIMLRLLQGIALGGETPGATTYIAESIPRHKGLACGIILFFLNNGFVLGSGVLVVLNSLFSQQQIQLWAWRLPFLFGGITGWISYVLRKKFYETASFQKQVDANEKIKFPLKHLLRFNFYAVICGFSLTAIAACIIATLFLFMKIYLNDILHYQVHYVTNLITIMLFVASVLNIVFGFLADRGNKRILYIILCISTALFAYPIFYLFVYHNVNLIIPFAVIAVLGGASWGVVLPILVEIFPTAIRYSGVAFVYNISAAIFVGLTPLINTVLIKWTDHLEAPAYYLSFVAVFSLFGFVLSYKKIRIYKIEDYSN